MVCVFTRLFLSKAKVENVRKYPRSDFNLTLVELEGFLIKPRIFTQEFESNPEFSWISNQTPNFYSNPTPS